MLGRSCAGHPTVRKGGVRRFGKAARATAAVFIFAACVSIAVPLVASAQVDLGLEYATTLGLTTTDIRITIGRIINAFLGFLGLLAVVLMLYAGFIWMTSAGNPEKITQAKRIMINATIGLVIILSAFAITQFIIRAITGEFPTTLGGTSGSGAQSLAAYRSGNSSALGNGIIEYHYPERGQIDVPRNTTITVTFKRPLVLSTVFKGYDDNGTFDTSDDTAPGVLELNTDNFKIIPNGSLEAAGSGSADEQFDNRYANALVDPVSGADVTQVTFPFDPNEMQTLVIIPPTLGSSTTDITYRVAIRGGSSGVKVWAPDPDTGNPVQEDAFASMTVDGGYFWPFATGTTFDLTPPRITSVVPRERANPATDPTVRNQLLQIYFSEGVDPTTASGILGAMGGLTNIEIKARCLSGLTPPHTCVWNGGNTTDFVTIPGTITIGNRYRTAEFLPSQPCEGVSENSCGEQVYCLPKNVEVRVKVLAATLSDEPPRAAIIRDGVVDLALNSFDGNKNGTAEGPLSVGRPTEFWRNQPPADLTAVNDTEYWLLHVGEDIDLVPPRIIDIDPKSLPPPDLLYDELQPRYSDLHGPSVFPPENDVFVLWSKIMSIGSMRTGSFDEAENKFTDDRTTVALRVYECEKDDREAVCADGGCPCTKLDAPSFFLDAGDGPVDVGGTDVTELKIRHRTFFTANDLGYTQDDILAVEERIPKYQPVIRAKIRDSRQNCFFPSEGFDCSAGGGAMTTSNASCCERDAQGAYNCPLEPAP